LAFGVTHAAAPDQRAIGHARDHHSAIAPAEQNDIAQIFEDQRVGDILDVGIKVDVWTSYVDPLADGS
jgi:hypothetical protein